MKPWREIFCALAIAALLAVNASGASAEERVGPSAGGELLYVPIYSSVFYHDDKRTLELAAMLSVHNVDPDRPLNVTRVDYYNTRGDLIRKYLDHPIPLKPLETKNFVVEKNDTTGGTGANFLVEWHAGTAVSSPIVEALMINAASGQGISFMTAGRVLKRFAPEKP